MASNALDAGAPDAKLPLDAGARARVVRWALVLALATLLAIAALARPLDHDESQYVASAVLARSGLPYRDFDYLQTPLQPLLFAPLAALWPGHLLVVLRLTNAALGLGAVLLLAKALRHAGWSRDAALPAALLLAASEPFLFGASTIRNDILPCFFECAGLAALMASSPREATRPSWASALLGLSLGLATATKISYALPLAAVIPGELLARRHGSGRVSLPAFLLGAMPPLAIVAGLALAAPHAFWFDVVRFPAEAPREWYARGPDAGKLGLLGRTIDYLRFAALGPALLLLGLLVWRKRTARRWLAREGETAILEAMLAAAILASLLTTPVWRQYLLPLLPVLILRAGTPETLAAPGRLRAAALAAFCLAGLAPTLAATATAARLGFPVIAAEHDAAAIRALLYHRSIGHEIATLSAERVADTGFALDPRFAAGPFLFRTRDGLGEGDRLTGVTQATFRARLQQAPPQSIVTGGEALDSGRAALDRDLAGWAVAHRYTNVGVTPAGMTVFARTNPCRHCGAN